MPKVIDETLNLILKSNDIDSMFDLICTKNYFAGQFGGKVPVDESRLVFKKIVKLITAKENKRCVDMIRNMPIKTSYGNNELFTLICKMQWTRK